MSKVCMVVPNTEGWEYVATTSPDEKGDLHLVSEPILAWGLTASGTLVPMTPTAPDGILNGRYVLRIRGQPTVYDGFIQYGNAELWLKEEQKTVLKGLSEVI